MSISELLDAGTSAAKAGDRELAARHLDELLSRDPLHAEALLYRGQISYELGDYDQAVHFFDRVPDSSRHASAARYAQGVLLVGQGFARAGESRLLAAAKMKADYLQPRERLVELYVSQMRRDDIRDQLDRIRNLRPWRLEELVLYSVASERVSNVEEGARQMRQFLANLPDDPINQFALARYLMDSEEFAEAEVVLERALAGDSGNSRLMGLAAEIKLLRNDVPGAAAVLSRLDAHSPPDMWFWRSCGRFWSKRAEWQKAAIALREAARLDPEDLSVAHQLGVALSRLQDARAAPQLRRAELMDRVVRQASRLPSRDRRNDDLVADIAFDVGDALLELTRYREAVYWFEQTLMLDANSQPARQGLQAARQKLQQEPASAGGLAPLPPPDAEWEQLLARVLPSPLDEGPKTPRVASETGSQIRLRDVHREAGIDFQYFNGQTGLKYLVESMGGGVAVLDYDLDGWPDLYLAQGCSLPFEPANRDHLDRLYRNTGDGRFVDVTIAAGLGDARYGQGCSAGDYDNDGAPDLMVANFGENVLYRNNGDGTFTDATRASGLKGDRWSSSVAFADLDDDGVLDLYVVNYVDSLRVCRSDTGHIATCDPQNFGAEQDRLYRGVGDGSFEDVTEACGIVAAEGKGLGIIVADLDNDGLSDIYIANDGTPNFLFRNASDGPGHLSFDEVASLSGVAVNGDGQAEGGMGIACADFQHDGLLDLYVTNFSDETNTFYHNLGELFFEDVSRQTEIASVTKPMVGFGTQPIDFDLDGHLDLIVANGHIDDFRFRDEPWKMSPQLFRNTGQGKFRQVSSEVGDFFQGKYLGRGAARLDWNRDGAPDAVLVHQDAPLALLRNETVSTGNYLRIRLRGVASNRDARGARVSVHTGALVQHLEWTSGDGFFSSNELSRSIGVGASEQVDKLEIRWPSGHIDAFRNQRVNRELCILEGGAAFVVDPDQGITAEKATPD